MNPCGAEAAIFWGNSVNTIAANTLAPYITVTSAAMVLAMWYKQVFHEARFRPPLPLSVEKLWQIKIYRKTSNIRCTLVGNKIVDHSDVVLHLRLNIWLQGIRQRQRQDSSRIF